MLRSACGSERCRDPREWEGAEMHIRLVECMRAKEKRGEGTPFHLRVYSDFDMQEKSLQRYSNQHWEMNWCYELMDHQGSTSGGFLISKRNGGKAPISVVPRCLRSSKA